MLLAVVCFVCVPFMSHGLHGFLDVVTYNTGLTPIVDRYKERRVMIGESIRKLDADVICLQEVWFSTDMSAIMDAVGRDRYPHTFSGLHVGVGHLRTTHFTDAPCMTKGFSIEFLPCFLAKCAAMSSDLEMLMCAKQKCRMFETLTQPCITCLVISGISNILQSCVDVRGTRFNELGLLLLSKRPIEHVRTRHFVADKVLIPRGYIDAEVDGLVKIVCTHLSANVGETYFEDLDYESWSQQNLAEARHVVRVLEHVHHVIVMGDLNSSPAVSQAAVEPDFPDSYAYLENHGYHGVYVNEHGICTWCTYNPLTKTRRNLILDHVMSKNLTITGIRRTLDRNLPGKTFPASDHFGIHVTFKRTGFLN
ncbi:uncharacterized protein LOC127877473 isoform X2 [Dreissena polymorpha]|uniref:Endonuclease/exonuclease/phosphatase domain-containing protein n=1 Tax=Dreissena polymorpha TaxID=45954 RepID=A0A9D4KIN0_DREPO|nr:uncharacterized protein LOC127877473 isoform X2 [Dreissena polymorpha]KAH3840578.1 hypothetical protein DPMN_114028 [Dreissena polymorpha]